MFPKTCRRKARCLVISTFGTGMARSHSSRALCEVPGSHGSFSGRGGLRHRQPEREERGKRGGCIDPGGYDANLFGLYPFLQKLFADGGYQGPVFQKASAKLLPHLEIEIVKRSDHAKGFELLPRRWVVERTFAWFNRCRRLAKDFENLTRNALAFLRLASIRLMLRKLCLS